jgi:hypothetical protein
MGGRIIDWMKYKIIQKNNKCSHITQVSFVSVKILRSLGLYKTMFSCSKN